MLNHACGHIQGSSFPIAGKGTHAAISAHRGLPSAKLFSDLDKLEVGDTFRITVLDKTFIYEVDQIKTVLPDDVSDLLIDEGMTYEKAYEDARITIQAPGYSEHHTGLAVDFNDVEEAI